MNNRVKDLLEESGYKPATFARMAGVNIQTFYGIIRGDRKFENVTVSNAIAIARGFNVSVEYLSGATDFRGLSYYTETSDILSKLTQLDDKDRIRVLGYIDRLLEDSKYQRSQEKIGAVSSGEGRKVQSA